MVCWVLFLHVTKQSRKGILPFSSISLVSWMLVFCLFKCSWDSSTGRNIPDLVFVSRVAFFVCGMLKSSHFGLHYSVELFRSLVSSLAAVETVSSRDVGISSFSLLRHLFTTTFL